MIFFGFFFFLFIQCFETFSFRMSYISTLNLLNADSPTQMNEEAFQEELALWANAQFSFDTTPGSAIVEDKKENSNLLETFKEIAQLGK